MTLNGEPYEVIGVVSPSLNITIEEPPDIYVPFQLDPNRDDNAHYFTVTGRLKPGITMAAANAQLQAGFPVYKRMHPLLFDSPQIGFGVQNLGEAIVGGIRNSGTVPPVSIRSFEGDVAY